MCQFKSKGSYGIRLGASASYATFPSPTSQYFLCNVTPPLKPLTLHVIGGYAQ